MSAVLKQKYFSGDENLERLQSVDGVACHARESGHRERFSQGSGFPPALE
jgi:hypothetical protein